MPDAKEKGAGGGLAEGLALGSGGQVEEALQGNATCLFTQLASRSGPASSIDLRNLPGNWTAGCNQCLHCCKDVLFIL